MIILLLTVLLLTGCENDTDPNKEVRNTDSVDKDLNVNVRGDIDYDLTKMNSDMVYATVYQMNSEPDKYAGKTVKIEGLYYAMCDEEDGQYYRYCIVEDEMACCGQLLEFMCGDGSSVYPDENTRIIVEGTLETYTKAEDQNLYCRLANATLETR